MGRISTVTTQTAISSSTFGNALQADYVSQTETGYTQTIPFPQPYSFLVYTTASTSYAISGITGATVYGGIDDAGSVDGADSVAVLQAAIDNCPDGGKVCMKVGYSANGTVDITNAYMTLEGEGSPKSWGTPFIKTLNVNSTTGTIRNVIFKNIFFNMIYFYQVGDYGIFDIHFQHCWIYSTGTTTTEGIVFAGNASGGQDGTHEIYFDRCIFTDEGQSSRSGFISFTDHNEGNGQIFIDKCDYTCNSGTHVFIACEDTGFVAPEIVISELNCVPGQGGTGSLKFIKIEDQTNGSYEGGLLYVVVDNCWFEIHIDTTFVELESATADIRAFTGVFKDNYLSIQTGDNAVLLTNSNSNWAAPGDNRVNAFVWKDNNGDRDRLSTGTLNEIEGEFHCFIHDNLNINPIGKVATPFDTTQNILTLGGDSATPAASTDYVVRSNSLTISSTDSGNADCAILIKDASGNQINPSALSSIDFRRLPYGYKITWGAYTGAAPTVVASFE